MQMVCCAQVQERLRGEHKPPHPAVNFDVRKLNIRKEEGKRVLFLFPRNCVVLDYITTLHMIMYLDIRGEVCDYFSISCFLQLKIHPPQQYLLWWETHQFFHVLLIWKHKKTIYQRMCWLEILHCSSRNQKLWCTSTFLPYYHQPTLPTEVFSSSWGPPIIVST